MIERRWLPPLVWAGCILIATSIPGAHIPRVDVPNLDKVVHFTFYGVFAWLLLPAMSGTRARRVAMVLAFIAVFAALDEFHQKFIPGRTMDFEDWVADMSGAVTAVLVAIAARRRAVAS